MSVSLTDDWDDGVIVLRPENESADSFAGGAFTKLKAEDSGHGYNKSRTFFANAKITPQEGTHTVFLFRDSAYDKLKSLERDTMEKVDTEAGLSLVQSIAKQHIVSGFVTDDFLQGKTDAREVTLRTLDDQMSVRILAPRIARSQLPATMKADDPIVQLLNRKGKPIKTVTARRSITDPNNPARQMIVVDDVLAVWKESK